MDEKIKQPQKPVTPEKRLVFGRENYYLIIAGFIIVIIGFLLMSGGKWTDPHEFNKDEIFSARRITLAPIIVILGFAIEVYAVFHKPRKKA